MIIDLELKLNGTIPVNREELFELVSSWGRKIGIKTFDNINIIECKRKECYDLSNLNISQLKDLFFVFYSSYFDGDLSKWNLSNIDNCNNMFENSNFNNDSICNWNVSNVKKTISMFEKSKFNKSLNNWDVSNIINMKYMFEQSKFSGNISSWILNHKIYCVKLPIAKAMGFSFKCLRFNLRHNF